MKFFNEGGLLKRRDARRIENTLPPSPSATLPRRSEGASGARGGGWSAIEVFVIPLGDLPQLLFAALTVSQKTEFIDAALFSIWSGFTSLCMKLYTIFDIDMQGRK